jgi:flagellin-like hook-associated protein FlgL
MATTRTLTNGTILTDWTEELNEIENQYGLFNGMNLFTGKGISQTTITFDKNYVTNTLLPQVSRRTNATVYGKDRATETFSLACPYFNHKDYLGAEDIQGWRQPGTNDSERALGTAIAEKMEDMRTNADQTREYMKLQATKGKTVDPSGATIADMFTEFSKTQKEIDFLLGTAGTKVDLKVAEMKRWVAKNAKIGGAIGRPEVPCSPEFFDALTTHPRIVNAYQYYASKIDPSREDLATYDKWGVVDRFYYKGVLFYSYDAEFNMPDGTTERAYGTGSGATLQEGYTIISGMRNLYRAYFGPANTLSGANQVGSEMNIYQFPDPKDKFHEMELEMSPLYLLMVPQISVRVHSSD